MYFLIKTLTTALLVAAISELSRRFPLWAALMASLPLTSILAFIWIYYESRDEQKIISLSYDIFWLVLPSLAFFLLLPWFLKTGVKFAPALALASLALALLYGACLFAYKNFR